MPQKSQIIPKYTQPYVELVINNNSIVDDDIVNDVTDEIAPYLCVFTSGKGPDNKLVSTESLKLHQARYGKSNYKLYGQPLLQAETILNQMNTKTWSMRIMPKDATYSNSIVSLWYKIDEDAKKFRIKVTSKSLSTIKDDGSVDKDMVEILSNRKSIIEKGKELDGAAVDGAYVDAEGYTQVPFACITSSGRGIYGENYSWRIARDENYEKEYGFKIYSFEAYESEDGTTMVGNYKASIVSSNKTEGAALINDIIEDKGVENIPIDIYVYEENIESLYDVFVSFVKKVLAEDPTIDYDIPELDEFDPLFGMQVSRNKVRVTPKDKMIQIVKLKTAEVDENADDFNAADYTTIESDKETESSTIILSDIDGNFLHGGTDGSFAVDKVNDPDGAKRKAAINEVYKEAFNGILDPTILSPRRIPSNAIFDANFDMDVKMELAKLALFRFDSMLYLDTGINPSITENDISGIERDFEKIYDMEDEFDIFPDYIISVNLHDYTIKESSTGKRVPATITNYLAQTHPNHWRNYGYWVPMVNSDYATLSGHVKNSLEPSIEEYEKELKERLHLSRINYFEVDGENSFVRRTQNTFTRENSDLIDENNVNTLLYLKRHITKDVNDGLYDFTDPQQRADFADFIKAKYDPMVGKQLLSIGIEYSMNQWEFNRSIVHMYVAIVFRQMQKRAIVEIDVNKRTYDEE